MTSRSNPGIEFDKSDFNKKAFKRARVFWVLIAVLACCWELYCYIAGYYAHYEDAYPTISLLIYPFTSHPQGMALFLLAYLWTGTYLFPLRKGK